MACQDLIQILVEDRNLRVKEVKTQYAIRNIDTHSVVLDVLAETENNTLVCIEIHLGEDGARYADIGGRRCLRDLCKS